MPGSFEPALPERPLNDEGTTPKRYPSTLACIDGKLGAPRHNQAIAGEKVLRKQGNSIERNSIRCSKPENAQLDLHPARPTRPKREMCWRHLGIDRPRRRDQTQTKRRRHLATTTSVAETSSATKRQSFETARYSYPSPADAWGGWPAKGRSGGGLVLDTQLTHATDLPVVPMCRRLFRL
jgi:hypothetical protein